MASKWSTEIVVIILTTVWWPSWERFGKTLDLTKCGTFKLPHTHSYTHTHNLESHVCRGKIDIKNQKNKQDVATLELLNGHVCECVHPSVRVLSQGLHWEWEKGKKSRRLSSLRHMCTTWCSKLSVSWKKRILRQFLKAGKLSKC